MPFTRKRSLAEPDLNKGRCPRHPGKGVRGRKKESILMQRWTMGQAALVG